MRQASSGLVLGPLILRGVAFLIDWLAITVLFLAVASVLGVLEFENGRLQNVESLVVLMVTMAVYQIGFLSWRSATPGKIAMNIYVAYPDGSAVTPDTAILRYIVVLIEVIVPLGILANIFIVGFDRDRRAIHDRVAGTIVLAGRAGAPLRVEEEPPVDL
jgi:uncharacterized RDD family membrane protein YckC